MAIPRFEALSGTVNGVNRVFTTSAAYTPGTVAVFLNGQLLKNPAGDPWVEQNPTTGEIELAVDCTPVKDDQLAAFYVDTLDSFVGEEVTPIYGSISELGSISGTLGDAEVVLASIEETDSVCGILTPINITGAVETQEVLSAVLEVC